jgi:phospholipase C
MRSGGSATAAVLAAVVTASALVALPAATSVGAATAASGPCGVLAYDPKAPPDYDHVVVIMDENLSFKAYTTSTQATYLHALGASCGTESNMHNATHSSQPNYMATTSGIASGNVHVSNDNLFHQLDTAQRTWRVYAEGMRGNCTGASSSAPTYKPGHNAPFWYQDLAGTMGSCKAYDSPAQPALDGAIANDTLPAFSWIVPDICNDMHSGGACSEPVSQRVAQGDAWMSTMIPRLTAMPSYQAGRTLIVITWDEGSGKASVGVDCTDPTYYPTHPDCQIPTIVVSPYVVTGATDHADHNLYGLLATFEDMFGVPRLAAAVGQANLRPGLGF